jgi:hypothetical protein
VLFFVAFVVGFLVDISVLVALAAICFGLVTYRCITEGSYANYTSYSYRNLRQWLHQVTVTSSRDGHAGYTGAVLRQLVGQSNSAGMYEEVGFLPDGHTIGMARRQRRWKMGMIAGLFVTSGICFADWKHHHASGGF